MPKPKSRPQRWAEAVSRALDALRELEELREEYDDWYGALPDNLNEGALGDKLREVTELDIQSAIDTIEEAEAIDLPRGFGRD